MGMIVMSVMITKSDSAEVDIITTNM